MTRWVKSFHSRTHELLDQASVAKIDLVTRVGKQLLPNGYWGGRHSHGGGPHELSAAEAHLLEPTLFLTFDDGPDPASTPYLLETLEAAGVQATFFVIGNQAERHPELLKQMHDAGHAIGNHSYRHCFMPMLGASCIEREIVRTNDIIEDITGQRPRIFRPPFGIIDKRAGDCLREQEMTPVYWGSAPEDWELTGADRIIRRVMWKVADGALIVLHEGHRLSKQTQSVSSEIISRCKELGYKFERVNPRAGLQTSSR